MRLPLRAALLCVTVAAGALSAARPFPHMIWLGTALPLDKSAMRGDFEMTAGKVKGTSALELSQRKDTPGAVRPWQLKRGTCKKSGAVYGDAAAYKPVTIGADGKGVSSLTVAMAVPDTGDFHVVVMTSLKEPNRIFACGDLVLED